jgi:predicted secreted protein
MAKTKSFGTTVSLGGTAIGSLTSITRSGTERSFADVTTHGSTGGYREFIPTLLDSGTVELQGLFDDADAGQDLLRGFSDTAASLVITLPNSKTITVSVFVQSVGEAIPLDDAVQFSCTLKITGSAAYSA